jgi:GNAT superfamily N-acetyltransferase
VEGKVEGYLLGCLDTRRQLRLWTRRILPAVGIKMLFTGWWLAAKNRQFARAMLRSARQGELDWPVDEILGRYPAHLHINIADPLLRGQGVGGALMKAYFQYLQEHNVKGVHLGTTSHNRLAVPFYYRLGFQLLHEARCTLYDHAIPDPPLSILYLGKTLT